MKPVIGILLREKESSRNIMAVNKEVSDMVISYGGIPIGIFTNDLYILNICNGFILPGGNNISDLDIDIIKYAYKKDIPILGICAGMQAMGLAFNGKLNIIKNNIHNRNVNYVHSVYLNKNSKLYSIYKKNYILVNSRHNEEINSTNLDISGYSENIIESIEDSNKKFFIGVQWHPESMIMYDEDTKKLIKEFIKATS